MHESYLRSFDSCGLRRSKAESNRGGTAATWWPGAEHNHASHGRVQTAAPSDGEG